MHKVIMSILMVSLFSSSCNKENIALNAPNIVTPIRDETEITKEVVQGSATALVAASNYTMPFCFSIRLRIAFS